MTKKPRWLLKGEPMGVQLEALRRSYPKKGWGHWLEQGLGKTAVDQNEFLLFIEDFGFHTHLILGPNSFLEGYKREAEKWGGVETFWVFEATQYKRFCEWHKKALMKGGPIQIAVNYEAIRSEHIFEYLMRCTGTKTMCSLDESVAIKNPSAIQSKKAVELSLSCGVRRNLSGKPIVGGPQDMFMQLKSLGWGHGKNFYAFRNRFCRMGGFKNKKIIGILNQGEFELLLSEWGWMARKKDWWSDMPEKLYPQPRKLNMSIEQRRAYNDMNNEFIADLENGSVVSVDQIITRNMKLQQICSGFIIDEEGKPHDLIEPSKNPIIQDIKYLLSNQISGRLIVVAWHTYFIDVLMDELKDYGVSVIRGKKRMKELGVNEAEEKVKFNEGDNRVIILQQKAAKYGHTLIGNEEMPCHTVYFAENSYSLDDRSQIEDRPHRWGQKFPVVYIDKVMADQDYKVIRALALKEDVTSALMGYDRLTGLLPDIASHKKDKTNSYKSAYHNAPIEESMELLIED